MLLEIRGHHLPGRRWQSGSERRDNIHVGVQIGRDPGDLVPGDSDTAVWTVALRVVPGDDGIDFRGAAVQGRRGARFVYLTWGEVGDDGSFAMFRRAKLMLADLEPFVGIERVIARVDLTDEKGGPTCARLRSPALILQNATASS